jgi:hypothetical protein
MIRDRDHLREGTCVAARASGFRADPSCRQRPLALKEVDVVWVFDVPAGTPPRQPGRYAAARRPSTTALLKPMR